MLSSDKENIKYYKPLALIEKDELYELKEKKAELERKLNRIEKEGKSQQQSTPNYQQAPPPPPPLQGNIVNQQLQQQRQKSVTFEPQPPKNKIQNKPSKQSNVVSKTSTEPQKDEDNQLSQRLKQIEIDKRKQQANFDRVKEELLQQNKELKDREAKAKQQSQSASTKLSEMEASKNAMEKEIKRLKNENFVLQRQFHQIQQTSNENEVLAKQSKTIQNEKDDRIKWVQRQLKDEEGRHEKTRYEVEALQEKIHDLTQEIQHLHRDRERLSLDIDNQAKKNNEQVHKFHEMKAKDHRDINDLQLQLKEQMRIVKDLEEKIRVLSLERERMMVRIQDLDKTQEKLRLREKQITELEYDLERVQREKGSVVIERIIKESLPPPPTYLYGPPVQSEPIIPDEVHYLRSEVEQYKEQIQRLSDDNNYWRKRVEQLEVAGDRAVDLLAHQNLSLHTSGKQFDQHNRKVFDNLKSATLSFLNDLQVIARKHNIEQVPTLLKKHKRLTDILQQ